MPGADKATARTVTVIVLILLAGLALRGRLPGAEPAADDPTERGPGSLIAVLLMLAVALAVLAVSVISQARRPVSRPSTAGDLARARGGEGWRFTWRMGLVLVGALLLWVLVALTLMRIGGWLDVAVHHPAAPEPDSGPGSPAGADAEPPPPPRAPGSTAVLGYFAAAAGLFVVLSVIGAIAGRGVRRRPVAAVTTAVDDDDAVPVSRTESLARAAERGLIEIGDLSRGPREAIIACYAAMERELCKSPGAMPRDSDTPTEVLARAVDRRLLHGESAAELVDLFEEARFSTHVMGEDHRDAAVRVLRLVLRELQDAT